MMDMCVCDCVWGIEGGDGDEDEDEEEEEGMCEGEIVYMRKVCCEMKGVECVREG